MLRAARAARRFEPWSPAVWWSRRDPKTRLALTSLAWVLGYLALRPEGQAVLLSPDEVIPEPCGCGLHPPGFPRLGKSFGTTIFPLFYVVTAGALALFARLRGR